MAERCKCNKTTVFLVQSCTVGLGSSCFGSCTSTRAEAAALESGLAHVDVVVATRDVMDL